MEPILNPRIWEDAMIRRLTEKSPLEKLWKEKLEWQEHKIKESLTPIELFAFKRIKNNHVRKFIMRKYRVESNSQGRKIYKGDKLIAEMRYSGTPVKISL